MNELEENILNELIYRNNIVKEMIKNMVIISNSLKSELLSETIKLISFIDKVEND